MIPVVHRVTDFLGTGQFTYRKSATLLQLSLSHSQLLVVAFWHAKSAGVFPSWWENHKILLTKKSTCIASVAHWVAKIEYVLHILFSLLYVCIKMIQNKPSWNNNKEHISKSVNYVVHSSDEIDHPATDNDTRQCLSGFQQLIKLIDTENKPSVYFLCNIL